MSKLARLVSEHLEVDVAKLTSSTRFVEDLGADSLDVAEMSIAVEEEFGVEISDDELSKIETYGDLEQLVA